MIFVSSFAAAADSGAPSGCPVLDGTACPASAGVELVHLAVAADRGCPFSTEQLIEKAQRCSDEATAGLARKAAEGDDEARVELLQRIKTLLSIDPGPPYQVLRHLESRVEIRQYDGQTWISTDYDSDNSSFRVLASYIFGQNQEGTKVAMTAPVITDAKMVFILPEGITPDNAPTPDGQPIELIEVPSRKVATLHFSWTTPRERVEQKTEQLIAVLRANGVRAKGQPFLMRYNDPGTPPFMRRHEVAIEAEYVTLRTFGLREAPELDVSCRCCPGFSARS